MNARRTLAAAAVGLAGLVILAAAGAGAPDAARAEETVEQQTGIRARKGPVVSKGVAPGQATQPLKTDLPRAMFTRTPKHIKPYPMLEKYLSTPRPAFFVPKGCTNVSRGRPVTSSDSLPIIGEIGYVTDGDKEGMDGSYVELAPGRQWVQIDLQRRCRLYAILLWHRHTEGCVYHDVVVQVSDDPDFIEGVHTVFNNDYDNSAGLGIGRDLEYIEDHQGRLIDAAGACGRYVRLYSSGSSDGDMNHYTEVEVQGRPAEWRAVARRTA
jgi:hypothetical protein